MTTIRKGMTGVMIVILVVACGGKATKKDRGARPPQDPSNADSFNKLDATNLVVTPYFTKWQFNEVYGDVDDKAGVLRDFAYAPAVKSELKLGWQEVQTSECTTDGEAAPLDVLIRLSADGAEKSRTTLELEQRFVVDAGESVRIRVSLANAAHCKALEVLFGVNEKPL